MSFDLPITKNDAQRDFNTALGTSLISGYFLLTIRFVHRNLASSLYAILVIKNQQSLFKHYNNEIAKSFKRHVVWCVSIGFLMPIFWINQPIHFFDLLLISCLLGFVVLFLMWPLFTLIFKLNSLSEKVFEENENLIRSYIKSNNAKVESSFIEKKITEQERYAHALTPSHYKKLATCFIPLPFSWLLFLVIESILIV